MYSTAALLLEWPIYPLGAASGVQAVSLGLTLEQNYILELVERNPGRLNTHVEYVLKAPLLAVKFGR